MVDLMFFCQSKNTILKLSLTQFFICFDKNRYVYQLLNCQTNLIALVGRIASGRCQFEIFCSGGTDSLDVLADELGTILSLRKKICSQCIIVTDLRVR